MSEEKKYSTVCVVTATWDEFTDYDTNNYKPAGSCVYVETFNYNTKEELVNLLETEIDGYETCTVNTIHIFENHREQ